MTSSTKEVDFNDINVKIGNETDKSRNNNSNEFLNVETGNVSKKDVSVSGWKVSEHEVENSPDTITFTKDGATKTRSDSILSSKHIYEEITDNLSVSKSKMIENNCLQTLIRRCWQRLKKSLTKHWKIWITSLATTSFILFVIVIILIGLLQQSESDNGSIHTANCTAAGKDVKKICDFNICLNNGTCSSNRDSFVCICNGGYYGEYCQYTPCTNHKCLNSGVCGIWNSTGFCRCPLGYTGTFCEETPCINITCQNGGHCLASGSRFICSCPNGASGTYCEDTPCSKSGVRCLNGGTCLFTSQSAACACQFEYYGEACEKTCHYGAKSFVCTFEDDEDDKCFLQNDTSDDLNWIRKSGSTPSRNTGPTFAIEGDYYLYLEASNPAKEDHVARMVSKTTFSGCIRCLRFSYHMYGLHVGDLNIFHGDSKIWTHSGNQGDTWKTVFLEIPEAVNKSIVFEAVRGSGISGDIAIDNVQFTPGSCP